MTTAGETRAEGRIGRLEIGFCSAFILILLGAWALYSGLGSRLEGIDGRLRSVEQNQIELRGDIKLIDAKLENMDKKLDAIANKVGAKP